jgi:Glycosyl transferase family 2
MRRRKCLQERSVTPQRSRQGRAQRAREHDLRRAQALTARTAWHADAPQAPHPILLTPSRCAKTRHSQQHRGRTQESRPTGREPCYLTDDGATQEMARDLAATSPGAVNIHVLNPTPKLTLGELRNEAIKRARGEYFCQWDDDDWYHNERLSRQYEACVSNCREASALTNWLIFDELDGSAYFSHFRLWEGSLFCRRDVVTTEVCYPSERRNEDSVFINMLMARGYIFPLVAAGLYIYTAHESNTWPREHFRTMFAAGQKLSADSTALIANILEGKFSVDEASALLRSEPLLKQLTYLPSNQPGA